MMQINDAPSMIVEINGTQYVGFTNASVSSSMLNITSSFSITATALEGNNYPISQGDKCRILLYQEPVITGYVNSVIPKIDVSSHDISISGRDNTSDIADSTLSGSIALNAPINLIDITKKVLKELNINDVNVISESDIKPFKKGEIIKCEIGESAFSFLGKYARKRQLLLTTDGKGNILYTRASDKTINTVLCKNEGNQYKPNILSSSTYYDDSNRFYKYTIHAQVNTSAAGEDDEYGEDEPEQETYITASITDDAIRQSRILNFMSDTSYINNADLQDRVKWEANSRKYDSFKYTAVVQGFLAEQDNKIWRPNMLVNVIDDSAKINSVLLITSVKFDYSLDGSFTTLEMVDKTTFSLEPVFAEAEKKKKEEGGSYISF